MKASDFIRIFLSCGLLIALGHTCYAQGCRVDYTFNYATYTSESTDGTYIYTSVLTDGSGSGSPSLGCNYPNARHTASSYNLLGSTGGWVNGNPGYMTSYLSTENDQQIIGVPGVEYTWDWDGEVICTVFGTLYGSGFSGTIGISEATWGPPPVILPNGQCKWATLACDPPGTTPKCTNIRGLIFTNGCPQYMHSDTLVIDGSCEPDLTIGIAASGPGPCY